MYYKRQIRSIRYFQVAWALWLGRREVKVIPIAARHYVWNMVTDFATVLNFWKFWIFFAQKSPSVPTKKSSLSCSWAWLCSVRRIIAVDRKVTKVCVYLCGAHWYRLQGQKTYHPIVVLECRRTVAEERMIRFCYVKIMKSTNSSKGRSHHAQNFSSVSMVIFLKSIVHIQVGTAVIWCEKLILIFLW